MRSALAQAATDLLVATSSPALVNHCLRTHAFGVAIAARDGLKPDPELFYVAAALHDLGLTERFGGQVPFEQAGAVAAAEFMAGRPGAETVVDAIALHLRLSTAEDPRPEVALVHLGAAMDVFGLGLGDLEPGTAVRVLDEHPRLDFAEAVTVLLGVEAARFPDSRAAELMALGAAGLIERTGRSFRVPGRSR